MALRPRVFARAPRRAFAYKRVMRRHLPPEPVSAAAVWCRRLAVFAATLALLAVALARLRKLDPIAALTALGAGVSLSLLALLLFAAACAAIWRTGARGAGEAAVGLVVALLTLAYPAFLSVQAVRLPVLADITTDPVDPPLFSRSSKAQAARGGFVAAEIEPRIRAPQRAAYPDIEPIIVDLDTDEAMALVARTAAALGWRLVDQRAPGGRSGDAHADFIDRSLVMGFDEDVAVRLRPLPGQTRIDLRAVSRYGRHDFGANAKRLEKFAEELQSQLDAR
jgi:uncharacterized protein (DUF1499 family)